MRTKVQRLPIEPISQASAQQRSGRCGRVEAGIAIRLYSQEDFEGRPEFTEPEILRTSLASVILQMTSLGLGQVERFPFVDPPDTQGGAGRRTAAGGARRPRRPARGMTGRRLTGVGRKLARLPIDPRLARMILEADRLGCLREVLVITAALSIQDPRERPVEQRARADQLHARFRDPRSDFLAWLNLWRHLRSQQQEMGSSAFRRMCRAGAPELPARARVAGLRVAAAPGGQAGRAQVRARRPDVPDADGIHQALLSGLLSHIGLRDTDRRDYLGARGARFAIFPGSGLFKSQPDFVMAAELVETSRLWGRQNAAIDPLWAERLGGDLVKRTLRRSRTGRRSASPRWPTSASPCTASRWSPTASYPSARQQPDVARELFIRHALVQGEWRARHRFFETNRRLLEEAAELEHRARRHDIVVDEETLFDFYDARIPAEVVSGAHFDTWWKQERRDRPDLLTFDPAMLVHEGAGLDEGDFPDAWHEGSAHAAAELPLRAGPRGRRRHHRRTARDPQHRRLRRRSPGTCPGLRHELVTALIRSLPKQLRVNFVPAPDVARRFLEAVPPGEEPLLEALSRYLRSLNGVHVPAGGVGPGARCPPTCGRPSACVDDDGCARSARARTSRRSRSRCGRRFDRAMQQVGRRVRAQRDRADHVDVRHHRAVVHPDPCRATRCTATRPWSTRAARSGCGSRRRRTSRRPSTVSAYDACCCSPSPRRPPRWSTASTTPPSSGWPPRRTPTSAR